MKGKRLHKVEMRVSKGRECGREREKREGKGWRERGEMKGMRRQ